MPVKQKRTYNIAPGTVRAVRELADEYHAAPTQDGVIELAVDELRRRIRDAEESAAWERAAADPAFRAEAEAVDTDLPVTNPETWPG
jgi:hypothetical protein